MGQLSIHYNELRPYGLTFHILHLRFRTHNDWERTIFMVSPQIVGFEHTIYGSRCSFPWRKRLRSRHCFLLTFQTCKFDCHIFLTMPKRKDRESCGKRTMLSTPDVCLLRATRALVGDYISNLETSSLATLMELEERVVKVWFQNQRQRQELLNSQDLANALFLMGDDPM